MTDDLYYRKLESTSTTDLVDMIREKDKRITDLENKLEQTEKDLADYQFNYPATKELQKENAELKKGKGLMKELLIALKIYGAKYNVSLIADAEKFLSEVEK